MKSKGFITLAILAGIGFVGSLLIEGPYASELTNGPFGDISAYVGIMKWVCLAVMIVCSNSPNCKKSQLGHYK